MTYDKFLRVNNLNYSNNNLYSSTDYWNDKYFSALTNHYRTYEEALATMATKYTQAFDTLGNLLATWESIADEEDEIVEEEVDERMFFDWEF